jgi:ribosome-binding protein aMBF1 (putative translation factor)
MDKNKILENGIISLYHEIEDYEKRGWNKTILGAEKIKYWEKCIKELEAERTTPEPIDYWRI